MTVSVIIATYNNERDICLAVSSILLQDHRDFELVIVNDGSTDATPEILERFAGQDERIVLLHNEQNVGRAFSRNRAIKASRNDLLAILDADDISMPHRLSRQVAYMQEHADVGLLGAWVIRIDAHNQPLYLQTGPVNDAGLRRVARQLRMPFCHSAVVFRREAVISAGLYDSRFIRSQDSHLVRRVAERTRMAVLPEPLVLYREANSPTPEQVRAKYRWSMLNARESLGQNPSAYGSLNFMRLFLLSYLPAPAASTVAHVQSQMYYRRRRKPVSETQRAELEAWLVELERCAQTMAGHHLAGILGG
jgi:glycosyltransferase involved in cell wall biosynthesis